MIGILESLLDHEGEPFQQGFYFRIGSSHPMVFVFKKDNQWVYRFRSDSTIPLLSNEVGGFHRMEEMDVRQHIGELREYANFLEGKLEKN